jgi:hypothetical protein
MVVRRRIPVLFSVAFVDDGKRSLTRPLKAGEGTVSSRECYILGSHGASFDAPYSRRYGTPMDNSLLAARGAICNYDWTGNSQRILKI